MKNAAQHLESETLVRDQNVIDLMDVKHRNLLKQEQIREYEDRFEYCYIKEYEEKYQDFEAHSIQLGPVFPVLLDLGDRMVFASIEFYKDGFSLDEIMDWLNEYQIFFGKSQARTQIINVHEIVQGLCFKGNPLILYQKGTRSLEINPKDYQEVIDDFVGSLQEIDTGKSKNVQDGFTIIYNGARVNKVPRIEL